MKRSIINIITILSVSIYIVGCQEFLTEYDPNTIDAENFPTNLDETDYTLNSLYAALYPEELLTIQESTIACDMGYPGYGRANVPTNATLESFYLHTFATSDSTVEDKWEALYTGIFRANQCIEYLNNLDDSYKEMEEWSLQMAQARFFRGLFHFYLSTVYNEGKIIIYDFVPTSDDDFYQPLSPAKDVTDFVREDLQYARITLPTSYSSTDDKFRVTTGAAATILGLSYIYDDEFDIAKVYFESVINSEVYTLADAEILFTAASGEFTSESILEINYCAGLKPELALSSDQRTTHQLGMTSSSSSFTPPAWIVDEYQCEQLDPLDERNTVDYPHYINGDSYQRNVSLRASAMLACTPDEDTQYYLNPSTTENVSSSLSSRFGNFRKYTNWDICESESDSGDGYKFSGKNITINRLSEVYLLYAECLLKGTNVNVTTALEYINKIRARWGLVLLGESSLGEYSDRTYDEKSYTAEELMEHIMYYEKPLELSCEGHFIRNIDLRRWGIYAERYNTLATQEYFLDSYSYYSVANRYEDVDPSEMTTSKKNSSWIRKIEHFVDGDDDEGNKITDYAKTASLFSEDDDLWWPIPLIEQTTNSKLYDIVGK